MTLDEAASYDVLDRLGIATPPRIVIHGTVPPDTLPFAYPVVAKLLSSAVTHKSDVGGVVLDIPNRDALVGAVARIRVAAGGHLPEGEGAPVLVTPMVGAAGEAMIGYRHDVQVGPLVLLAPGGTAVDLTGERSVRLAPVDAAEAWEMIAELPSLRALAGYRGAPPGDLEALAAGVAALSRLADDPLPVVEAEINPLRIGRAGEGAVAVDAVIRLAGAGQAPPDVVSRPTRR